MRFLHCADIHLDSPLRGLERYEGAPVDEVRGATRRAFENLVELAVRERVDFVVIAGDLYDGDWQDFNTGLFFTRMMSQLGESGVPAYVLRGNHDAASRITRSLRLPANVRLFRDGSPETFIDEQAGVALHGQSFASAAVIDDLAAAYPAAIKGVFNLGVLHTSLTGRPGHNNYAPTTEAVLRGRGYDYWALGHVHAREIVSREPWVVYPGNLQGRHAREQGPKGCELVTVEGDRIASEAVALDVLRWATLSIDAGGLPDTEALLEQAVRAVQGGLAQADGRTLAIRLRVGGQGDLHRALAVRAEAWINELRAATIEASGGSAWLEKVELQVRPAVEDAQRAATDDALGLLAREMAAIGADPAQLEALADEVLKDLRLKLPPDLVLEDGQRLDTHEALACLLAEAQDELRARLEGEGSGA